MEAKSEGPGRRNEFLLRTPLLEKLQETLQHGTDTNRSLEGIRVAVIDENCDGADIMGMLIEEQGASVRVAYDGTSGIAAAREFRPVVRSSSDCGYDPLAWAQAALTK
jgi:hypothetical protein